LRDSGAEEASYDGMSTDAAMLFVRSEGRRVLAVQSATRVTRRGEALFKSDKPVSVVAEFNGDGVHLSISSDRPATIRLRKPDGRIAEVSAQSGRHEMVVALEER
jgi:hypothetical protein